MIFFADMFSYTQYQCRETVSQAVSSRVTSRCTSEFPFPIPCNPHNLTQLLGKNLNEIHNDSDYFLIVRTLQMQCPRPCAAQSYDVKHTTSKNVFKGIERLVQGGVLEPPENQKSFVTQKCENFQTVRLLRALCKYQITYISLKYTVLLTGAKPIF